jgi:glycosyltransferase involved in cell wall biosynthesis
MKILVATGIYPPDIGGPATYSKLLKDELPKRGIDVKVLSFGEVRHLPKIVRHLAYFTKILKMSKGVDLVYSQDPVSVGLPSILAAKILGKKFILKMVGDYAWEQQQQKNGNSFFTMEDFQNMKVDLITSFRRKIERFVGKKSDRVVVPSNYLKKIVVSWGVKEEKIKVVYNAFASKNVDETKEELRKIFGFEGNIIFSVGRLVPWKGFELLIEIMKDLPNIKLFIAGDGPDKEKLKKKIKDLRLDDRVKLVGRLEQNDLLKKIKASDLFVLNTGYEGLSHQLLEVMAVGTPIITTNMGGNLEVVDDGKEGILVSYNNKKELKKAILCLLNDKEKTENLAKNAQEKVKSFNKEKMLEKTINTITLV